MTKRRRQRVRAERARRIRACARAFLWLGCLACVDDDMHAELLHYRDRVRAEAEARVKIAMACAIHGLKPSTAMKLLNATLEEDRTV